MKVNFEKLNLKQRNRIGAITFRSPKPFDFRQPQDFRKKRPQVTKPPDLTLPADFRK